MSRTATRLIVAAIIAWVFSWAAVHESFAKKSDDTLVVAIAIRSVDRLYTGPREGLIPAQLTDDGLFYVDPETLDYTPWPPSRTNGWTTRRWTSRYAPT